MKKRNKIAKDLFTTKYRKRIVKPNKIFMGEKDFQKLFLVKKFLKNKYGTEVIGCKNKREKNKVALSSRNYLLSKENVALASVIIRK